MSMSVCSIDKCNRKVKAKGYCDMHWRRIKKHDDPLYTYSGLKYAVIARRTAEKEFWK
jgi:hypothetical protein